MSTFLFVLAVLVIAPSSYCQLQKECSSLTSCSQCLTVPSCVWCSSPAASAHCLSRATANMCSNTSHIVDPHGNVTINTLPLMNRGRSKSGFCWTVKMKHENRRSRRNILFAAGNKKMVQSPEQLAQREKYSLLFI